jgi:cobyrinic acid a,c-diamide synthase
VGIPRIVVAGVTSGVGKTTVTTAIMYAFKKKGLRVQPFKIGPDFIDPSYHTFVTGRQSRNLDAWMMGKNGILNCFRDATYGADISVIEGVMGLFDGFSGRTDFASTAHIAKILKAQVILVIDTAKAARSIAAIAFGFLHFDKNLRISGIILNNVASDKHAKFVIDAFTDKIKVPILGIIKRDNKIKMEERHLGLIPALELKDMRRKILHAARYVSEQIDLDKLKILYKPVEEIRKQPAFPNSKIKIAVAMDQSFNFYYADNLYKLRKQRVEIVLFSPLSDSKPPENVSGIIIGGGFPEVLADKLEKNQSMIKSISKLAGDEIPIYAECGGLMYLTRSITRYKGMGCREKEKKRKMVGLIDADTLMNTKLTLNYTQADSHGSIFGNISNVRGHEFHYSEIKNIASDSKLVFVMKKGNGVDGKKDGFSVYGSLSSYMHLHFADSRLPKRLIEHCITYSHR